MSTYLAPQSWTCPTCGPCVGDVVANSPTRRYCRTCIYRAIRAMKRAPAAGFCYEVSHRALKISLNFAPPYGRPWIGAREWARWRTCACGVKFLGVGSACPWCEVRP